MSQYQAPLRDMRFNIEEVFDFTSHYASFPQGREASPDIVTAVLESAAQFAEEVLAPLDAIGDKIGCTWHDGEVTTPPGFKEAYAEYIGNGWTTLAMPTELGGQGLPPSLAGFCMEIMCSANHAWTMYPGLSLGGIQTIAAHADDDLKRRYLPNLIAGTWSATMCLTEAHCGSDLGLLRTRATPTADGSYRISGSKIFISSGEHDLTDNIVHIVLARLPDAPPGIKGISLFLVPKFMVDEKGQRGSRNTVRCGSIEHKMGIHGNATCVINFDEATGYLISPPHKGMSCMFTFINESRMGVAQQALSQIEVSHQTALRYAHERVQFRASMRSNPDAAADPIIVHPDIRRMLLTQRAFAACLANPERHASAFLLACFFALHARPVGAQPRRDFHSTEQQKRQHEGYEVIADAEDEQRADERPAGRQHGAGDAAGDGRRCPRSAFVRHPHRGYRPGR